MKKVRQASAEEGETVRFGVYLDLETRKELLKAAIDEGISATQLVAQLIRQYLTRRSRKATKG